MPRFQVPPSPPISLGAMNVGNVHVENSNVGVINTGRIASIHSAVGELRQTGAVDIAQAISELLTAIASATAVTNETKNQMTDILSSLVDEAAKPATERRLGLVRGCLVEFSTLVGGVAGLSDLWQTYGPTLYAFFGA